MNPNDHGRKEPSLADLEAFEKLLRETLHETPVAAAQAPGTTEPAAAPMSRADHDAMAELTRLIEQPLDFSLPSFPPAKAPAAPAPEPAPISVEAAEAALAEAAPLPDMHTHVEAHFEPEWPAVTPVSAQMAEPVAPPAAEAPPAPDIALDPLAAFEEELRRFDATRLHPAPAVPDFVVPTPLASEPPATLAERQQAEEAAFAAQHYADEPALHAAEPARHEPTAYEPAYHEPVQYEPEPVAPPSALEVAEQRLAAEAAAANYDPGEPQASDVKRSRAIFMGLGGLAVAGLAVIGGTFALSGGKKGSSSGEIPVIAAKTEPAKEKPADPGGVEIPNQDAQVLAGRNATREMTPAKQVVNTTEQPVDLKEITRRDSVRVVAPNPFQQSPQTPMTLSPNAAPSAPPADAEPRRVTSVRVPVGGEAASAGTSGTAAVAAGAAAVAAGAAMATRSATAPKAEVPKGPPPAIAAPDNKSEARPPKKADAPKADTPKAEAPKTTPPAKVANAPATPKASTPEKAAPAKKEAKAKDPRAKDPMSLTDETAKAKAPPAASGTFAVQLASRPTEADARSAASSLGSKFSSQLGGKAARVVSGEANGQTVYRVRAGGYSQAAATEACNRIKAAGGACFIAKQ